MRLVVAPDGEGDFDEIVRTSADAFGEAAAHRYRLLIQQAYGDILARPERPKAPGVPHALRLYPIRHSRRGLPLAHRVGQPRHVLIYRFNAECLQIVRILHDRMDIPAALNEPQRPPP